MSPHSELHSKMTRFRAAVQSWLPKTMHAGCWSTARMRQFLKRACALQLCRTNLRREPPLRNVSLQRLPSCALQIALSLKHQHSVCSAAILSRRRARPGSALKPRIALLEQLFCERAPPNLRRSRVTSLPARIEQPLNEALSILPKQRNEMTLRRLN